MMLLIFAMERHTDLFTLALGPTQGDPSVFLVSISSILSQGR